MTPAQQNAAATITIAVAPTVGVVAIATTNTGTTSGGTVTNVAANGPSNSALSGSPSGYTGS